MFGCLVWVTVFTVFPLWTRAIQTDCKTGCATTGSPYNVSCTGTVPATCEFYQGATKLVTCPQGGGCIKEPHGYPGVWINERHCVLLIDSLTSSTDVRCKFGAEEDTCTIPLVTVKPEGTLEGSCISGTVSCTGLTNLGTPALTLELKDDNTVLASTTSETKVEVPLNNTDDKTFTCLVSGTGAPCVHPISVDVTCTVNCSASNAIFGVSLALLFVNCVFISLPIILHTKGKFTQVPFHPVFLLLAGTVVLADVICTVCYFALCQGIGGGMDPAAAGLSIVDTIAGVGLIIVMIIIKHVTRCEA